MKIYIIKKLVANILVAQMVVAVMVVILENVAAIVVVKDVVMIKLTVVQSKKKFEDSITPIKKVFIF